MSVETTTVRLLHRVRAEHAATGRPLARLRAEFVGARPVGWVITYKRGYVLVSRREGLPAPAAPPTMRVSVADAADARWLNPATLDVTLDSMELVQRFEPIDMTVAVELLDPSGAPVTGRTVTARGSDASEVDLLEAGDPTGTYRSARRRWSSAYYPFDLLVNGTPIRKASVNFAKTETLLRVVDTT